MLTQHIVEQTADTTLVNCIGDPSAIASTSSLAWDDAPSQAAMLLSYEELSTTDGDIHMEESMEALGITEPPEYEGVMMWGASHSPSPHSPHPQLLWDQEDSNEPTSGFE
jgi:hypothetical protein